MKSTITRWAFALTALTGLTAPAVVVASETTAPAWAYHVEAVVTCIPGTGNVLEVTGHNDEPQTVLPDGTKVDNPAFAMDMTPALGDQVFTPSTQKDVHTQGSATFKTTLANNYQGGHGAIQSTWTDGHPGGDSFPFDVPPVKDCLLPPVPVNPGAEVVCKAEGGQYGTSVFTIKTKPEPGVAYNPADGTPVNSGESQKVTATWTDSNNEPQSRIIETEPVAMCTVTPPPPDVTPKAPHAENQVKAWAECNGGEYYLKTKLVSGNPDVAFAPADGTPLTKGQHLVVTASWGTAPTATATSAVPINVDVPMTPCAIAMPTTGSAISTNALVGIAAAVAGLIFLEWERRKKKEEKLQAA